MKFKKLIVGITVLAALVVTGCSKQQKKAQPILTKTQVINKSQKSFKSGQVKQSLTLGTDTSAQVITADTGFGGTPTVFHINYQTQNKGKTRNAEEWVNMNNLYLNGQNTWYRTKLDDFSGHSYADMVDATVNNKLIFNPSTTLTNAYKMKRNKNTYTLTANISNQSLMKKAADPIWTTTGQSPQQEKAFQRIQKYGKYKNMTVKMVVKNKKLTNFQYFVNMKIGNSMKLRLGQVYSNFGSHDFLKVPETALNAKPLPKNNKSKK